MEIFPKTLSNPRHLIALYMGAASMVAFVGVVDEKSGWELSVSIFYLIPVALVALYGSARAAIGFAVVAAVTWLIADSSARSYPHWAITGWNAVVRLGFFLVVAVTLARLRALVEREREQATTDYVTGLSNSRSMYLSLEREIERMRRNSISLTLAFLDLDNFKAVNDRSGHIVGDEVLRMVGRLLSDSVRAVDYVARLGGDEFAILMPETDQAEARISLERVRVCLSSRMKEHDWPVTLSIGAVTAKVPPAIVEHFVKAADEQMYRAKKAGKNCLFIEEYRGQNQDQRLDIKPTAG